MRRLLALLALLTLALPACATAQPAASRAPGVGQDNAEITIRIAVLPVLETLPLYVADREGYFAARNVKVEIVPFRAPLERDTALITGQVDAQYTDLMSAMLLNRDEPRTQVINAVIRSTPEQPRFFLLVSPQSNITSPSQLRNTDIAISRNTIIEYVADMLTQREGLRESEIR
ncbi:MAG: MetQ/NlpA family ABC transporter substrate-binding protein, partial [Dehalococcoidia bacterium]|nr:MetQ/NlpA family ABC transporter substrate-binding protein [Dehalococcoidia bacterium]